MDCIFFDADKRDLLAEMVLDVIDDDPALPWREPALCRYIGTDWPGVETYQLVGQHRTQRLEIRTDVAACALDQARHLERGVGQVGVFEAEPRRQRFGKLGHSRRLEIETHHTHQGLGFLPAAILVTRWREGERPACPLLV